MEAFRCPGGQPAWAGSSSAGPGCKGWVTDLNSSGPGSALQFQSCPNHPAQLQQDAEEHKAWKPLRLTADGQLFPAPCPSHRGSVPMDINRNTFLWCQVVHPRVAHSSQMLHHKKGLYSTEEMEEESKTIFLHMRTACCALQH